MSQAHSLPRSSGIQSPRNHSARVPALPIPTPSPEAHLYLAALKGARVCSLESAIGNLKVGNQFDALHVSLRPESGKPAVWWEKDGEDD